jgi:hypothetical protein
MPSLDLLLEAEKRGILPEDKKPLLQEARKRGLVGEAANSSTETMPSYDVMGSPTGYSENVPVRKSSDPIGVGAKTAIMEPIYGIGEFIPGSIGQKSAAAAKELEQQYKESTQKYPVATRMGYFPTLAATLAGPGILGKALGYVPKIAEAATALGRVGTAAREGAITGAAYEAAEPTGEIDVYQRAKEKALNALKGGVTGAVLGGLGVGGVEAFKAIKEEAPKSLIGVSTKTAEDIVAPFEARGYKLEPMQMTRDEPSYSPGFMKNKVTNQNLANADAAFATGRAVGEKGVDRTFLNERFDTLGEEYDKIYSKQPYFTIDQQAVNDLNSIVQAESEVAPGKSVRASQAASNLIRKVEQEGNSINSKFLGDVLSELKKDVRSASGREKYILSDVISSINDSVIRNHREVAKELADLNKKYKSTIILDDLSSGKSPGIRNGDISLRQLGANIDRLKGTDLYNLGEFGQASNLSARWEGAGKKDVLAPESILSPSKLARALASGIGTRSQFARKIQRGLED